MMTPKPVPTCQAAASMSCESLVCSKKECAIVVLEHATTNHSGNGFLKVKSCMQIWQHAFHDKQLHQHATEHAALAFLHAECDLSHEFQFPNWRTATQTDEESHARAGAVWVAVWFDTEKTTKVSVNPRVQVECAIRVQDHAFVHSLFQMANESLNGCCVTLFWCVGEAGCAEKQHAKCPGACSS